ncbi:MAG: oxaloacetate decarboxylase, partial [Hyphomicrobiales bacterium]
WDAGSARLLAHLGFEALATTSAGFAFSLGRPDGIGHISRAEALAHARDIVAATPLPVSADLENGYGDAPETVAETVRQAAQAGLCGCTIEDTTGDDDSPIYDFSLAVERISAAVEAAGNVPGGFVLTARSENFLHGRPDLADTIARLQAFEAAGAHVLYAPGLPDLASMRAVVEATSKPVNVVMGLAGSSITLADLTEIGIARVSTGSALARAALGEFLRAAREIRQTGTFEFSAQAATFTTLNEIFSGKKSIE